MEAGSAIGFERLLSNCSMELPTRSLAWSRFSWSQTGPARRAGSISSKAVLPPQLGSAQPLVRRLVASSFNTSAIASLSCLWEPSLHLHLSCCGPRFQRRFRSATNLKANLLLQPLPRSFQHEETSFSERSQSMDCLARGPIRTERSGDDTCTHRARCSALYCRRQHLADADPPARNP